MLDYNYVKIINYRLIAVNSKQQKELNLGPEAIQQIEFAGQLKHLDANDDAIDAGPDEYMFVLTI